MTMELYMTLLTICFGGLLWFIKDTKATNDKNHEIHFRHAASAALHETERERNLERLSTHNNIEEVSRAIIRHADHDNVKFDKIDTKIDVISRDIKDVLKMLSEKAAAKAAGA